jgi:hypothetical protein
MARNEKALSNLAVAFTTSKAMVHFHKAASTEWPDGLACNGIAISIIDMGEAVIAKEMTLGTREATRK